MLKKSPPSRRGRARTPGANLNETSKMAMTAKDENEYEEESKIQEEKKERNRFEATD